MILRNYYSMQPYTLMSHSGGYVSTSGVEGVVSSGTPNIKSLMQTRLTAYSGAGVVFGTGDAEPTLVDTKLSGNIVTGYTSSYSQSSGVDTDGRPYVRTLYTLTNTGSTAKTIKEVGLLATVASSTYALIERTVLDEPVTLAASNGVGQVEYIVYYNPPETPPQGGTEAFNACAGDDVYGVEWDMSASTSLTRIGAAADFAAPSPATSLTETGSSPFDAIQPWAGMERKTIGDDEMVYIPEFYYACGKDRFGRRWRWAISPTAKEGFAKHPGSGRYVGRYHTSGSSSAVYSKTGVKPLVSTTRPNFRTYSHNKGDGWWMIDVATWSAIQLLYLVEFANWDSQTTLGTGYAGYSAVTTVGGTDSAAYHTVKRSGSSNMYRWLEDLWSNCLDWVDGLTWSSQYSYITLDNSACTDTTAGATATGLYTPNGVYIQNYHYCEAFPWAFLPSQGGSSNSGYIPDYVYSNYPCVYVGGVYNANGDRGLFCSYCDTASSSSASIGSRLLYIP